MVMYNCKVTIKKINQGYNFLLSHERTQHGQVNNMEVDGEQDEFGYFVCRQRCGKTYKTKQGRNK